MSISRPQALRIMDFALRIGDMLLSNGAGTADVQATMSSICRHLGLRGTYVDVTYIMLTVVHSDDEDDVPLVLRRNVPRRTTDFQAVTDIDQLVTDLLTDDVDLGQARIRLAGIMSRGKGRPRWLVAAANGLVGVGVSAALGGGAVVLALAFVSTVIVDTIRAELTRRRLPDFYVQIVAALVATLIAVMAVAVGLAVSPTQVIASGIVVLIAALGLIGALQDAVTGYYLTAGARLLEVLLSTAGIVAGVGMGITVGHRLGVDLEVESWAVSTPNQSLLAVGLGGAVAAVGFAVASYAPSRVILAIGVLGGAAGAAAGLLARWGAEGSIPAAIVAVLLGAVSYPVARFSRVPVLVILVSAIVPLLPGLKVYISLTQLTERDLNGIFAGLSAVAVAVALASGVILGEYLAQPVRRETRRLERRLAGPRLVGPFRASLRRRN